MTLIFVFRKIGCSYELNEIIVGFIPFFVFRFLVKVTKKQKNQLSFSGKMRIFYTENKQTGQLNFFAFGHFDQKTKNEMNRTIIRLYATIKLGGLISWSWPDPDLDLILISLFFNGKSWSSNQEKLIFKSWLQVQRKWNFWKKPKRH